MRPSSQPCLACHSFLGGEEGRGDFVHMAATSWEALGWMDGWQGRTHGDQGFQRPAAAAAAGVDGCSTGEASLQLATDAPNVPRLRGTPPYPSLRVRGRSPQSLPLMERTGASRGQLLCRPHGAADAPRSSRSGAPLFPVLLRSRRRSTRVRARNPPGSCLLLPQTSGATPRHSRRCDIGSSPPQAPQGGREQPHSAEKYPK